MKQGNTIPLPFKDSSHVVGIGASAGGLEALARFFLNLQGNSGMAFVVIQHLSPDFKSIMDELLGRFTSMPVLRVDKPVTPRANHVYILFPGQLN